MVNIEIDGKEIQAKDGALLIEAADDAGIAIPRFCYHKKLSVAANCRMCLVEVEKAAKPLPACATPVTDGMKVFTRSPRAISAQKSVMEFLLINHPLDCPICDQGGECDLQDIAVGYGGDHSQYSEGKRVVQDKDIGPLVSTDMTRCIHCTRCVRFGQEVAGVHELGGTGRGEHMQIGTYVEKSMTSEMSGNIIDLCPVGALTSKPFRFQARAWEMASNKGVAAHDCVGSNTFVESLRGSVRRVTAAENDEINETWISDRDRFSYEGLNTADRLKVPMIKRDGVWEETDWETALNFTVSGLRSEMGRHGAGQLGALISPNSTIEEMYLAQKLVRGLGSSNIDHRLQQRDFSDQDSLPLYQGLGRSIESIDGLDSALFIGSNIRHEQPIIAHRLRKSTLRGGKAMFINPVNYSFQFDVFEKDIRGLSLMESSLAGVAKALTDSGCDISSKLSSVLSNIIPSDEQKRMASALLSGEKSAVILGAGALAHPNLSHLRVLAKAISSMSGSTYGELTPGSNSQGAMLAGAVPHRIAGGKGASYGLNTSSMLDEKLPAYLIMNVEAEFDLLESSVACEALANADFVVNLTSYISDVAKQHSNVLLPIATVAETSGTFVNVEGRWQGFTGMVKPLGESRPAWKVFRVLGNLFSLDNFDYVMSSDIKFELEAELKSSSSEVENKEFVIESLSKISEVLLRIADVPIYATDSVVRRAASLQKTLQASNAKVRVNRAVAQNADILGAERVLVTQNGMQRVISLEIDDCVADGCVWLPAGLSATSGFGAHGDVIALERA